MTRPAPQQPLPLSAAEEKLRREVDRAAGIAAVPRILDVICRVTGMGFAAVARVTENRWIACEVVDHINFGLKPHGELEVETTICHEIRQHGREVAIDHVAEHTTFKGHHTPAKYGFQSYISIPIFLSDKQFFGTLCAIDPRPAKVDNKETIEMFRLFAELIALHYDALENVARSELKLTEEREVSELREQFIAVLGHDLRNPLGAISSGASLLGMMKLDGRGADVLGIVQKSVGRMAALIENLMDFARGRLGGGLAMDSHAEMLAPALLHVIEELQVTAPERAVNTQFDLDRPVYCDSRRVAQLLSNLLGNALTYGAADVPVTVTAQRNRDSFTLSVANGGAPIPPEKIAKLFLPFSRGEMSPNAEGLGLGLYIASEIASAHGGSLTVSSDATETKFTFTMPQPVTAS